MHSGFICLGLSLRYFHIPICEVGPEELVDLSSGFTILERLEESFHVPDKSLKARPDPAIGQSVIVPMFPLLIADC